jgi:hypothetical protein
MTTSTLPASTDPDRATYELESFAGDLLTSLDHALADAASGRESGAHDYAAAWLALTRRLWDALASEGRTVDDSGLWVSLKTEALSAPFSPWVGEFGSGRGVALVALASVRRWKGLAPLSRAADPKASASGWAEGAVEKFAWAAVRDLLEPSPLDHVASVFGLSDTELAGLFGVRRQALAGWRRHVPDGRSSKLLTIQRIADLLKRKLIADRIPAIARTPAPAYGGRSILQMISDDDEVELLELLEETFDWGATA